MSEQIILFTGKPGVGKSTLLSKIIDLIPEKERCGFVTKEITVDDQRVGFQIVSSGQRKILAQREEADLPNPTRFGRWTISIDNMQYFVDNCMPTPEPGQTFILDEIGPMQCLNQNFMQRVEQLFEGAQKGQYKIIGTIKRDPCEIASIDDFLNKIKKQVGAGVIEVTELNRQDLFDIFS